MASCGTGVTACILALVSKLISLFDVNWIVNKVSLSSMELVLKQEQSWVIPYLHI